jgi:hypothetical protein
MWHENKMIYNETVAFGSNLSKRSNPEERKVLLLPDYDNATYETLPNGAVMATVGAVDFKFSNPKVGFFRTFVFLGASGKIVDGKIVEFYGDPEYIKKNRKYLVSNYNKKSLKGFTGSVFTYDVYYRPLRNRNYKDGEITANLPGIVRRPATAAKQVSTNTTVMSIKQCEGQTTRMTACFDVFWVTAYSSEYLYSFCCEDAGGGGPGGGGTTEPPVPIDSFSGFPANPIEGQAVVCIDSYGYPVEFTYSASMGVWLMPELQALRDLGNTLTVPNMPTFDPGHILTSIVLPSLIEPTFFGEAVLAGAAAVVATVYVYEFVRWVSVKDRLDTNEYCSGLCAMQTIFLLASL